jgi:hypothetical protein
VPINLLLDKPASSINQSIGVNIMDRNRALNIVERWSKLKPASKARLRDSKAHVWQYGFIRQAHIVLGLDMKLPKTSWRDLKKNHRKHRRNTHA